MAAVIVLGAAVLAAYAFLNSTNRDALARIVSIYGAVRIVESPEKEIIATLDAQFYEGNRILTAPGATVKMAFTSDAHATLQSDSALTVESLEKARLEYGTARIETTESAFIIETRHVRIETDKGSAEITANDTDTQVKCHSGKVRVRSDGEDIHLSTGESHILGRSQQSSRVEKRTPTAFISPSENVAAGPTGAISGTITNPDGKPVSGVSLELLKYTPYLDEYVILAGPTVLDRTTTNDDGYYAFGQLPAGEYRIVVKSCDYAPDEIARVVIDGNEIASAVNWKLKPALPITIRAIDEAQQPVANVSITAWAVRESDFLFFVQEDVMTNDVGECVVNIAADMKGEVRAFPENFILVETEISPNTATAELVLRKGHSIRGVAFDETGQFLFPPVQKGALRLMALVPDSSVPQGARVEIDSITGPITSQS